MWCYKNEHVYFSFYLFEKIIRFSNYTSLSRKCEQSHFLFFRGNHEIL
ncbi:MAG: hypothetical protein ACTSU4_15525 [Promethearchaeota archaeon]